MLIVMQYTSITIFLHRMFQKNIIIIIIEHTMKVQYVGLYYKIFQW